jgi:hypothetical protein
MTGEGFRMQESRVARAKDSTLTWLAAHYFDSLASCALHLDQIPYGLAP